VHEKLVKASAKLVLDLTGGASDDDSSSGHTARTSHPQYCKLDFSYKHA
jgi:hypothetical protein